MAHGWEALSQLVGMTQDFLEFEEMGVIYKNKETSSI
jgi:hypothetical protein